jgi:ERCC4-type nuclease
VKKVKRDNITPQNIGEIMLSQIPGVSPNVAQTILSKFRSFPHFVAELQTNPECMKNMTVESSGKTRKISKTVIKSIVEYISEKHN